MSRLGVGSTVQQFVIAKFLGKGSYGAVYKVRRKDDGKDYAMKQINTQKMVRPHRSRVLSSPIIDVDVLLAVVLSLVRHPRSRKRSERTLSTRCGFHSQAKRPARTTD